MQCVIYACISASITMYLAAINQCCFIPACMYPDYPPTWKTPQGRKKEAMIMPEVQKGTQEYIDAVKEFEVSLTKDKVSIEKVERIENRNEYGKHLALQKAIRDKHKKEPEVRRLFHGSKQESLELIAVQGFNRIFAANANGNNMMSV